MLFIITMYWNNGIVIYTNNIFETERQSLLKFRSIRRHLEKLSDAFYYSFDSFVFLTLDALFKRMKFISLPEVCITQS